QLRALAVKKVESLKFAITQSAFTTIRRGLEEELQLAEFALAAMDSEPHTDDELSNLLWYSQEATCHSDPNYYCEFQRLATPGLIAGIIRELLERRKAAMDSKPVILYRQINPVNGMKTYWAELDPEEFRHLKQHTDENAEFMTLYRHAQPASELNPVGYLFVSEQGAIAYSPTDWGMPGFKLAGQIFGDIDVELKPAPVVQCPFPCGRDNLNKLAIQDAALVARGLVEGELTTEAHRQAAISNNDRLLKVISACLAAMLAAAPQEVKP
ncbi:TPA: hypothetical protein ACOEVN_005485, partial [Klebsiella pneumoniae]